MKFGKGQDTELPKKGKRIGIRWVLKIKRMVILSKIGGKKLQATS
jgi:hypothetical protein